MPDQRLQQALSNWQKWAVTLPETPAVISELKSGLTNQNYLLASGSQRMVLRLNAPHSEWLGIDRQREAVILDTVSQAGIAPPVYYCAPEEGVLITEYVEGQPLDIHNPESIQRIQALFEQVHQLQPEIPVFDYRQHIANYQQAAGQGASLSPLLNKALQTLQAASGEGLCHHDPTVGNIIDSNGRLYLIDWEYAGLGAIEFDKAAIRTEWAGFCTKPDRTSELRSAAENTYKSLCNLWKIINKSHF